jgi:hypothetical protein
VDKSLHRLFYLCNLSLNMCFSYEIGTDCYAFIPEQLTHWLHSTDWLHASLSLNSFTYSKGSFKQQKIISPKNQLTPSLVREVNFWTLSPKGSIWAPTQMLITCFSIVHYNINFLSIGRAIAEAVSRWLPTAAARVQSRVWSSGICGGQSGEGGGFLRVLRFPLPFIPPNSPSSQSPGAGTIGQ